MTEYNPTVLTFVKFVAEFYQRISQPRYNLCGGTFGTRQYGHISSYAYPIIAGYKSRSFPERGGNSISRPGLSVYGFLTDAYWDYVGIEKGSGSILDFREIKEKVCNDNPRMVQFIDDMLTNIVYVLNTLHGDIYPMNPVDEKIKSYLMRVFGDQNTAGSIRNIFADNLDVKRVYDLVNDYDEYMSPVFKKRKGCILCI